MQIAVPSRTSAKKIRRIIVRGCMYVCRARQYTTARALGQTSSSANMHLHVGLSVAKGSASTREGMGRLFNLRHGANITHQVASWRASVPHDAGSAAMLLLRATTDSYRTSRAREQKKRFVFKFPDCIARQFMRTDNQNRISFCGVTHVIGQCVHHS